MIDRFSVPQRGRETEGDGGTKMKHFNTSAGSESSKGEGRGKQLLLLSAGVLLGTAYDMNDIR